MTIPHRTAKRLRVSALSAPWAPSPTSLFRLLAWLAWLALLAAAALATLAARPASARTLDRRAAVRRALEQNPQIAAARAEEQAAMAQRRQADAARWPLVSFTAAFGPSMQATLVPGTAVQSVESQYKNFSWSDLSVVMMGDLSVIQPIYTFGKIAKRQEAADHGLHAREAQTRMKRADVALEVATLYEGYLFARDAQLSFEETLHWLDRTLDSAEERLAKGATGVSERDVLRLRSGKALAAIGQNQARAGMAEATSGLAAYLGFPQNEPIVFAEPELQSIGRTPESISALVALAGDHRPELTALREGQRALDALGRAEAAGFLPDIFALGLVSVAYTPGRDWLETRFVIDPLNHFYPALLVGLRWQFEGNMAQARAAEQYAQAAVLQHTAEWADVGIPAEVRVALEELHRTDLDVAKGTEGVTQARKWVVMAGADYAIGFLDAREVSDSLLAYVTLRNALLRARFDHNVAMAALNKATGTLDGGSELFYLAPPPPPSATGKEAGAAAGRLPSLRNLGPADARAPAQLHLAAATGASADKDAEATIRQTIDAAFAVLKDKELASRARRHERIAALRAIADKVFDWSEMARGSVGVQWRTLPAADRRKFVEVFKDVLAAQYIDDIDRFEGTEKVTVDGSSPQGEDVAVRTTLITASHDHVPMDYRMHLEQGQWRVVDISIEGVSLVNHFRKTFSDALANMSVQQLIERLKQQLPTK